MEENDLRMEVVTLLEEFKNPKYSGNKIISRNFVWYKKATRRNLLIWYALQFVTLSTGFLTTILLSLSGKNYLESGCWKMFLIILPSIGSFAYSVIIQFKLFELWTIRDKGRYLYYNFYAEFRKEMIKCQEPDDYRILLDKMINTIKKIEQEQSLAYISLFGSRNRPSEKCNEEENVI
ncbi:MAG: hypothetical protein WCK34_07760 [Bacteroidota bacterium]